MPQLPAWPIWKEAPFIRLIIPFTGGLICQWYMTWPVITVWLLISISALALWLFSFKRLSYQYHGQWWNGLWVNTMLFATGFLLFYYKDIQLQPSCISSRYVAGNAVLVTIEEPLCEKQQSFKTVASVQAVFSNHSFHNALGNILLYFPKDSMVQRFHYGNQLLLFKALQPVKNSGNPGCFDYKRYCRFQNIFYQVYLRQGEYVALKIKNENLFRKYLLSIREKINGILTKYINGKKEAGLAEAMLIGYKDDLDKSLVQSYSNTGVVHIIAISGMHLGLIYWLLTLLCRPLINFKWASYIQPCIVIAGLWLFSCMAGGSPSVLRSAVMFTCLVSGAQVNRKTSIYNSLAASAFLLLCYNPYWLWDAGFQLSYAAVVSLGVFFKPIFNLFYFQNKIADFIWKSIAVTLAAQIFTVPVSVYHFHQFPNLFLSANLLAVPLSGIIILGEIILCLASIIPVVATGIGYVLQQVIFWLNSYIERVGSLPFATTTGLQVNLFQLACIYVCIGAFAWWLLHKNKAGVHIAFTTLLLFFTSQTMAMWNALQQKKLIVYNIPKHSAIDVIIGNQYFFKGDSTIQQNDFLQNFYVQPCRLQHRVTHRYNTGNLLVCNNLFRFGHTSVLIINEPLPLKNTVPKMAVDAIILSQNVPVQISRLTDMFTCRQVVFDSSNPVWKVNKWQQECARLGLPCFSVTNHGAFVLNLY